MQLSKPCFSVTYGTTEASKNQLYEYTCVHSNKALFLHHTSRFADIDFKLRFANSTHVQYKYTDEVDMNEYVLR